MAAISIRMVMAVIQDDWQHVEDWLKESGVWFLLQVSKLTLWVTGSELLRFLVMAVISNVEVEDRPKLSGVWFLFQVSMLIPWVMTATSQIYGKGCSCKMADKMIQLIQRWLPKCHLKPNWNFEFFHWVFRSSFHSDVMWFTFYLSWN